MLALERFDLRDGGLRLQRVAEIISNVPLVFVLVTRRGFIGGQHVECRKFRQDLRYPFTHIHPV